MKIMSSNQIWRLMERSKVEFAPDPQLTELALKTLGEGVSDEEVFALSDAGYLVMGEKNWELTLEAEFQLTMLFPKEMAEFRAILDILESQ